MRRCPAMAAKGYSLGLRRPWSNKWSIVGVVKNARMREPANLSSLQEARPVNLPVSWSIDRDSLSVCINDMDDDFIKI